MVIHSTAAHPKAWDAQWNVCNVRPLSLYVLFRRRVGGVQKLSQGFETLHMTYEGLGEMFGGDFSDIFEKQFWASEDPISGSKNILSDSESVILLSCLIMLNIRAVTIF